jgi:lipopolysaccharide export system protein LptA
VARGDAQANHEDKQVNADTLVAHFRPNDKDETEIRQIVATGNVRITTPTDYVVGDEGVYYVQEEVATLTGDVKITRDGNQMNGNYAEVNLATGISQLRGNVDALILPKAKPEEDKSQWAARTGTIQPSRRPRPPPPAIARAWWPTMPALPRSTSARASRSARCSGG